MTADASDPPGPHQEVDDIRVRDGGRGTNPYMRAVPERPQAGAAGLPGAGRPHRRRSPARAIAAVGMGVMLAMGVACGSAEEERNPSGDTPTTASDSSTSTSDVPGTTEGTAPDGEAPGAPAGSSTTVSSIPGATPGKPNAPVGDMGDQGQQAPGPTQP
jgi:hypothetical protein